ncbi:hypothetical protein [Streptomyces sp. NPDC001068]|uniref:hypothetical protein n=1 Tax=Streptomyces sp. NPDC001068 TaxID=3364544 RepID=UPI00368E278C
MTSTAAYLQAAQRARTIAYVARDRFADGQIRAAILAIAACLDEAARELDAAATTAPAQVPDSAASEVFMAEQHAVDCPRTRFPALLGEYVLAPLGGRTLPMPEPLRPLDAERAARETDLVNRLEQLHADTEMQADAPDTWLRTVLMVWQKHMRLADEVLATNGRPCNQR